MARDREDSADRKVLAGLQDVVPVLAVFGGLGLAGGLLLLVAMPAEMGTYIVPTLGVSLALLGVAAVLSAGRLRSALAGPRRRHALPALAIGAVVAAALVLANLMADRWGPRWDVTAGSRFGLAEQTLRTLHDLPEPIEIVAFFAGPSPQRTHVTDLLRQIEAGAGGKVRTRVVDPDVEPSAALSLGLRSFPSVVARAPQSGRRHVLTGGAIGEQDLLGAVLTVTGAQRKTVYFLTGHQERDIRDVEGNSSGYGLIARRLMADGYDVKPLNLTESGGVPDDAAVVAVADPRRDLTDDEAKALDAWFADGGRVLVLAEPRPPSSVADLLDRWGVAVGSGAVVDAEHSVIGDPRAPLVRDVQLTRALSITGGDADGGTVDAAFFPHATAVAPRGEAAGVSAGTARRPTFMPLARSSAQSWLAREPTRERFDPAADLPGPHLLALAIAWTPTPGEGGQSAEKSESTLVVFGDADFASNRYQGGLSNADLLLNSVNWLARDVDLISLRPKPTAYRRLVVTRSELDFIRYSSWLLLPVAIGGIGIVVWWRRRA